MFCVAFGLAHEPTSLHIGFDIARPCCILFLPSFFLIRVNITSYDKFNYELLHIYSE
jgi:hypothetical protein